jgi:hypothetical protein
LDPRTFFLPVIANNKNISFPKSYKQQLICVISLSILGLFYNKCPSLIWYFKIRHKRGHINTTFC